MKQIQVISPIDNQCLLTRDYANDEQITQTINAAQQAQQQWRRTNITERAKLLGNAIDHMVANKAELAREISQMMGRPIRYAEGEIKGLAERGRHMIAIAQEQLNDLQVDEAATIQPNTRRFIRRVPLGTVFTIAPWNYPYLTAVNSIIPALMAGNTVILKHSAQTLLCAERFQQAFAAAGLPTGVFNYLHLDHQATSQIIQSNRINYVSFTGSVDGGVAIEQAAAGKFLGVALELGGKDPAYVREDADLDHAAEQIADGAFFNSGQSCCGIERVYVHHSQYAAFIEKITAVVKHYQLGDPLDPATTLGPMVSTKSANYVRQQIEQAIAAGATAHIDPNTFSNNQVDTPYLAPQILTDVDHSMSVMKDESFGPVIGIMPVKDDEQAISLMNDSPFGLTASIWTLDQAAAETIGNQLDTGTVFMNRCDYLDPALAWVGVKHSGRGCALSTLAYQQVTRPKSFNLNLR